MNRRVKGPTRWISSTLNEPITADLTSDTLVTAAHRTVSVSVSGNWANFENVIATEYDDTLTPNGKNNVLVGGDGHDVYRILETVSGTATFVEQPRPSVSNPSLGGVDQIDFSTFVGGRHVRHERRRQHAGHRPDDQAPQRGERRRSGEL